MKYFVVEDTVYSQLGDPIIDTIVSVKAKFVESLPESGYTNIPLPEDWDKYYFLANQVEYKVFRNNLIDTFASAVDYDSLSLISKRALCRFNVWRPGETVANLDLLYTQVQRDEYTHKCMNELNTFCGCDIKKSNVVGSVKFFDKQVNDSGGLEPLEVTTYNIL